MNFKSRVNVTLDGPELHTLRIPMCEATDCRQPAERAVVEPARSMVAYCVDHAEEGLERAAQAFEKRKRLADSLRQIDK